MEMISKKENKLNRVGKWSLLIVLLSALVLLARYGWMHWLRDQPRILNAAIGGSIAAAATATGTLPLLFSRRLSERVMDGMLGFGAGVMLAATAFSLTIPGIQSAEDLGFTPWGAASIVGAAILLGAFLVLMMEHYVPHEHFIKGVEPNAAHRLKRTWMFVFAIALHNLPEGLAIGVAFGGANPVGASALAAGIAIQDIPEGLVVALALFQAGYSRRTSMAIGILSGLVEPIAAVVGAAVVTLSSTLLPWGMGFAAGAMLFVISHEVIPESHRKGHESFATAGLMIGFVIMMMLDTALG